MEMNVAIYIMSARVVFFDVIIDSIWRYISIDTSRYIDTFADVEPRRPEMA